jgi:hypothetical protein
LAWANHENDGTPPPSYALLLLLQVVMPLATAFKLPPQLAMLSKSVLTKSVPAHRKALNELGDVRLYLAAGMAGCRHECVGVCLGVKEVCAVSRHEGDVLGAQEGCMKILAEGRTHWAKESGHLIDCAWAQRLLCTRFCPDPLALGEAVQALPMSQLAQNLTDGFAHSSVRHTTC